MTRVLGICLFVVIVTAATHIVQPCPPVLEIGQTYAEIKQGPCPDIDSMAAFRAPDSVHVAYFCPSRHVMVIGDMRTGRMDAFFLYNGR